MIPIMHQKWRHLFFIHEECDPDLIQETLPKGLYVDTFDGKAYCGIVPFKVYGVRPLFIPPLPFLSSFLEVNVRTYVYNDKGVKGVWFYSLDASRLLPVIGAKLTYFLPYIYSSIKCHHRQNRFYFQVVRGQTSYFEMEHENVFYKALEHTLDYFLIERYKLFSFHNNKLYSAQVLHPSYLLAKAHLVCMHNCLTSLVSQDGKEPILHYSPGVDVKATYLTKVLN